MRLTRFQSEEMQNQAIEVAQEAMDKFSIEKDIAQHIKKEVCIIGSVSGSLRLNR
jgi:hypothetical protein